MVNWVYSGEIRLWPSRILIEDGVIDCDDPRLSSDEESDGVNAGIVFIIEENLTNI